MYSVAVALVLTGAQQRSRRSRVASDSSFTTQRSPLMMPQDDRASRCLWCMSTYFAVLHNTCNPNNTIWKKPGGPDSRYIRTHVFVQCTFPFFPAHGDSAFVGSFPTFQNTAPVDSHLLKSAVLIQIGFCIPHVQQVGIADPIDVNRLQHRPGHHPGPPLTTTDYHVRMGHRDAERGKMPCGFFC